MISDHGWDTILAIITALIGATSTFYARKSLKTGERVEKNSQAIMKQCMRSILMRVFTNQVKLPYETVIELYDAYRIAGGNHEVGGYAKKYFAKIGKDDK
mgnify:FL=1